MPPASPSPQPQFVFAKTAHRYTQHHGSHEPPLVQEGPRPRRPTGATSDNAGPGRTARWRRRRGIAGHLPDDLDGQRCRANRRSRRRSRRQNSTGRSDRWWHAADTPHRPSTHRIRRPSTGKQFGNPAETANHRQRREAPTTRLADSVVVETNARPQIAAQQKGGKPPSQLRWRPISFRKQSATSWLRTSDGSY